MDKTSTLSEKIVGIWAKWCRICCANPERAPIYQWLTGTQWPPESKVEWEKKHPKKAHKILEDYLKYAEEHGIETGCRRVNLNRRFRNAILMGLSMGRWFF